MELKNHRKVIGKRQHGDTKSTLPGVVLKPTVAAKDETVHTIASAHIPEWTTRVREGQAVSQDDGIACLASLMRCERS
jgi:hypothetical protein